MRKGDLLTSAVELQVDEADAIVDFERTSSWSTSCCRMHESDHAPRDVDLTTFLPSPRPLVSSLSADLTFYPVSIFSSYSQVLPLSNLCTTGPSPPLLFINHLLPRPPPLPSLPPTPQTRPQTRRQTSTLTPCASRTPSFNARIPPCQIAQALLKPQVTVEEEGEGHRASTVSMWVA